MTQSRKGESQDDSSEPLSLEQQHRIMEVGEEASRLLQSPVYNLAYRNVMDGIFHNFIESHPKEEKLRESLYYQVQGLKEVTMLLATSVADAQRIRTELDEENSVDRKYQEHLNTQGFGLELN